MLELFYVAIALLSDCVTRELMMMHVVGFFRNSNLLNVCLQHCLMLQFPERVYRTQSAVMCLDFSKAHPNLLAVSCSSDIINHSINQSIHRSVDRSISQPVSKAIYRQYYVMLQGI